MYRQIQAHKQARLHNGTPIMPVATLEDEHGGRAHIWIDDHCYQVGVEREHRGNVHPKNYVVPVTHIFPEAFKVLKTLPDLIPG